MKTIIFFTLLLLGLTFTSSQWVLDSPIPHDTIGDTPPILTHMVVVDSTVSWITGFYQSSQNIVYPYIAKRTLSGWKQIHPFGFTSRKPVWISAKDSSHAWIGTYFGKLLYTSDGGYHWNVQIALADSGFFDGIAFSKKYPTVGYSFADYVEGGNLLGIHILKTIDGGLTWSQSSFLKQGYAGDWSAISFIDSSFVWFGLACNMCHNLQICMTSNAGLNWISVSTGGYGNGPNGLQFSSDDLTGIFIDTWSTNKIYRTTNSGINWYSNFDLNQFTPKALKWVEGTSDIYMNDLVGFMKSDDNGLNWTTMTPTFNGDEQVWYLDAVKINNGNIYALAFTNTYFVYKLLDTVSLFGINKSGNEVPKDFKLYQNYPNPFNPVTTIKYDIPVDSKVTIKVYDMLGKEVVTLVNENKQAGYYETIFYADNFASGVYFYKLESGSFVSMKKMVLVK